MALRIAAAMNDQAMDRELLRARESLNQQLQIIEAVQAHNEPALELTRVRELLRTHLALAELGLADPHLFRAQIRAMTQTRSPRQLQSPTSQPTAVQQQQQQTPESRPTGTPQEERQTPRSQPSATPLRQQQQQTPESRPTGTRQEERQTPQSQPPATPLQQQQQQQEQQEQQQQQQQQQNTAPPGQPVPDRAPSPGSGQNGNGGRR
jgi:hypothetical protein